MKDLNAHRTIKSRRQGLTLSRFQGPVAPAPHLLRYALNEVKKYE